MFIYPNGYGIQNFHKLIMRLIVPTTQHHNSSHIRAALEQVHLPKSSPVKLKKMADKKDAHNNTWLLYIPEGTMATQQITEEQAQTEYLPDAIKTCIHQMGATLRSDTDLNKVVTTYAILSNDNNLPKKPQNNYICYGITDLAAFLQPLLLPLNLPGKDRNTEITKEDIKDQLSYIVTHNIHPVRLEKRAATDRYDLLLPVKSEEHPAKTEIAKLLMVRLKDLFYASALTLCPKPDVNLYHEIFDACKYISTKTDPITPNVQHTIHIANTYETASVTIVTPETVTEETLEADIISTHHLLKTDEPDDNYGNSGETISLLLDTLCENHGFSWSFLDYDMNLELD